MFQKDTFRLIRKTFKRFVTIFLIVVIGVGFMVGLMSSAPTMRASVDKYFDDTNFMDIQLYSSYGFDDRDIEVLGSSDIVDELFASKFVDVFLKNDTSTVVTRVQEIDSSLNIYELIEGRMPQKSNEALALGSSSFGNYFKIGDKAELYLEDEELSESLECTEYEIVGIVKTPQYMASSREISTLDNISLSTVIYVDNDNFLNDYYTSVYLTLKDSKELDFFSEEYENFIEEKLDEFQLVVDSQEDERKEKIYNDAVKEIADGEQELADEIAKANKEIADGEQELADAYQQLVDAEEVLSSSEDQIRHAEEQLEEGKAKLSSSEAMIKDGKAQIEQQMGIPFDAASENITNVYNLYMMINQMISGYPALENIPLSLYIMGREATIAELTNAVTAISTESALLELFSSQLESANVALETEINTLNSEINALKAENETLDPSVPGNAEKIEANNAAIAAKNAEIKIKSTVITQNNDTISANKAKILSNNAAIAEYSENIKQLTIEVETLKAAAASFGGAEQTNATFGQIRDNMDLMFGGSVTTVYQNIQQLIEGEKQLESGKDELESNRKKVKKARNQIEEGKIELEENKQKYYDGLAEIEDAKKELAKETEKARIDIDKAKQDLAELPDAEWIVLDREEHYSTAMYKSNADQMKRIGNVFPLLFCLVAALVCMTTMKRLVDEQRSQIGVFSALGFSKGQITGKYVIYALSASLLGSCIGIPIGVFSLPWVIYFCWKMMYDLPAMTLTMPVYIAVIGVSLFTFLMVWVTFTVVRSTLKECPSQLMRPKAPRTAKKVFLENIPFIWKNLSFTSKVTARNIIRYKSRFFMTVVGVAGCTSLLVLGFAIKGSIGQVITRQYGDILHYDLTITLEDSDYLDNIYDALTRDKNVEYAVPFMTYSAMAKSDTEEKAINVYIMDENDIYDIIDLKNRKTKEKLSIHDGVVISEKYAKLCNIKAGDIIKMESSNGIKKDVVVSGICEMYTQHYMFISDKYYEDIFNETVYCDHIAVDNIDSDALIASFEDTEGVKTIADFADTIATFSSMLDTLDIIVVVVIIAAGSLALVVIMNLTEVNISERIREIATLKVLGFNNKEVYSYIFKEVFILSLIGMILGLPLGRLELVFVMDIIEMEMVMFSTVVEPLTYLYGFSIILLFTIMVILLMRKTLRNVEMVESLKSVE